MEKCNSCVHCEMCKWIDQVNKAGCDFYTENCSDKETEILNFIEDNYPTEINTDWERGCAYALNEVEKIIGVDKGSPSPLKESE